MILERLRARIVDRQPNVGVVIRGGKLFVSESPESKWLVAWAMQLEGPALLVELCDLDGTIVACRDLDEAADLICEGIGCYFEAKGVEAIARAVADPFWSHLQRFAAFGQPDANHEPSRRPQAWRVDRGLASERRPLPRRKEAIEAVCPARV